jgi:hypothetical protein
MSDKVKAVYRRAVFDANTQSLNALLDKSKQLLTKDSIIVPVISVSESVETKILRLEQEEQELMMILRNLIGE